MANDFRGEGYIDSLGIIARIEELEDQQEQDEETGEEIGLDPDEQAELAALKALADEGESYAADWRYGATLIREDCFTDYCRELVSDIGDLPRDIPDYLVIDLDATADNMRADYTEIDFDGTTYLVR